jgi:hypothetical protein
VKSPGGAKSPQLPSGGTLDQWVHHCINGSHAPPSFYAGARKIIRPYTLLFAPFDKSLSLASAGFTTNKLKALTKHYLHEESRNVAARLWEKRRTQENYGSVSFTTFNHFVKGDVHGNTPRGSIFGPCLQSVVLTHIDKKTYAIDVFYRSTELFKKFAPDLVLIRDVLLQPFDFSHMQCSNIHFHFANITLHPMYYVTIVPFLGNPVASISAIPDDHFRNWIIKWTARYLCPEYHRGIAKFAQALRVQKDAHERIDKVRLKNLQSYLRKNHPGYRYERTHDDPNED